MSPIKLKKAHVPMFDGQRFYSGNDGGLYTQHEATSLVLRGQARYVRGHAPLS